MSQNGLFNMCFGFFVIVISASAGAFLANELTYRYLQEQISIDWNQLINTASHGHTSLFGLIQVVFGLTLPYSVITASFKRVQTIGLTMGTVAMGPGMMIKALDPPMTTFDLTGLIIGLLLCAWLASVGSHAYGLFAKIRTA